VARRKNYRNEYDYRTDSESELGGNPGTKGTMKPGQFINIEDGDGVIHVMMVTEVNEANRTVTGEIAVYPNKNHHPVLETITVCEHQIVAQQISKKHGKSML
jgi:hypothetical protein